MIENHYGKINLSLPAGTKVFYVNIMDSVGNSTSTNVVTLGDTTFSVENFFSKKRIQFDPIVWQAPKTYDDAPDSLNYPGEKAIYYEGLDYQGHKTKVFAYIGYPPNASKNNKVPAVILVHGGAGTAFPQWVKIWNDKGYAAIAMDLEGRQPLNPGSQSITKHELGGPVNTNFAESAYQSVGPDVAVTTGGFFMSAREAVSAVRARAGMPAFPAGMSKDAFEKKYRNERRIEFAFEEHRFFDVRRWKILDQTDKFVTGMRITKTGSNLSYKRFKFTDRNCSSTKWLMYPIDQSEVDKIIGFSGVVWQNPGW